MPIARTAAVLALTLSLSPALRAADSGDDFLGYWRTAQGDAVIQLQRCAIYHGGPPTGLCGVIVWESEVGKPNRTSPVDCNRKIFEAARYDNGVWKDGWAFDTRKRKAYNAKLRLKDGHVHVRAYVGSEVNGETEIFTRVTEVPTGCEGVQPGSALVGGGM